MKRTRQNTTREEYVQDVKDELVKLLEDGEPCYHKGCLNHKTHPCEICGRLAGIRQHRQAIPKDIIEGGTVFILGDDDLLHEKTMVVDMV